MYNPIEEREKYTVTVVRNIGIPISFTVKRSKFLIYLAISGVVLLFLLLSTIGFLLYWSQIDDLEIELEKALRKIEAQSNQIYKLDHDRYWINDQSKTTEVASIKESLIEQEEFSTEGIWTTSKRTLSEEDLLEGTSVEIDRFDVSVKGDDLYITLRLANTSSPIQAIGGYIFITLVNNDYSPPLFKSASERGKLGENGYPASYKLGVQYLIKRRVSTKKLKFRLTEVKEYYTDVMVFLYSYKGRLLTRQIMPLDKKIFLE